MYSILNSCAVIVPVTVKSPSNVSVVFFSLSFANDCDTDVNEPDMSDAICAELDNNVGLLSILLKSTYDDVVENDDEITSVIPEPSPSKLPENDPLYTYTLPDNISDNGFCIATLFSPKNTSPFNRFGVAFDLPAPKTTPEPFTATLVTIPRFCIRFDPVGATFVSAHSIQM